MRLVQECLANPNQGRSDFPHNFGVHMNIIDFILKVEILVLIKWSYKSPKFMWAIRVIR